MSDTLQKMAIALADVENELIRRAGSADEPSEDFRSIFDDHDEDEDDEDFFDDEDDDSEDD